MFTGIIEEIGTVRAVARKGDLARLEVSAALTLEGSDLGDRGLAPLLVPQGSVAVDGVSLTVASLDDAAFEVMLIPHTLAVTTLGRLAAGQAVNIETDVIGKYVQRSLAVKGA